MSLLDISNQRLAVVFDCRNSWSDRSIGRAVGVWENAISAYVPVIMSVIFAGAPIVNAIVSTTKEVTAHVKLLILGISLAALGGYLATKHAPKPPKCTAAEASIRKLSILKG